MNRALFSAVLTLVLTGSLAVAQQSSPSQSAPSDSTQPAAGQGHHHRANAHREALMLSRRLNLTPDQTARLEPILADRDQKMSSLHTDTSLAPEAKRSQMQSIRLDTKQQLSNVLTPEQMEKMQSMHRRHGGHEQTPATPSGV